MQTGFMVGYSGKPPPKREEKKDKRDMEERYVESDGRPYYQSKSNTEKGNDASEGTQSGGDSEAVRATVTGDRGRGGG
jgi:hypothetical protein